MLSGNIDNVCKNYAPAAGAGATIDAITTAIVRQALVASALWDPVLGEPGGSEAPIDAVLSNGGVLAGSDDATVLAKAMEQIEDVAAAGDAEGGRASDATDGMAGGGEGEGEGEGEGGEGAPRRRGLPVREAFDQLVASGAPLPSASTASDVHAM